jgi:mxaK protein
MAVTSLLVFSVVFAYKAYRLYDVMQFNSSVSDGDFNEASGKSSIHRLFADGYVYQQRGEFEQALQTYAHIETSDHTEFRTAVKYNMANLYLQKASAAEQRGDHDLVIPLIELAKQIYRELLRANSSDWQAKYNLERALQLLPDVDEQEVADEVMPERSPRALGVVEVYDQLP